MNRHTTHARIPRTLLAGVLALALTPGPGCADDTGSAGGSASAALGTASSGTGAAGTATPAKKPGELFGEPLSDAPAVTLAEVLDAPAKFAEGTHKVTARVKTVCKEKGCWMTLVRKDGAEHLPVRVRFKDYGFFVPKDCDGAMATVEGTVSVTEESMEVAKHYAEDEGRDPATVTGPVKTVAIMASGAVIDRGI